MFGCVWICLGFNKKVLKWPFHATHCEWFVPSFEAAKNWGSAGPLQQVLQWTWKRPEISRDGAALIVLLMQFFIQCHWFAPVENGDLSHYRLEKLQAGAGSRNHPQYDPLFRWCVFSHSASTHRMDLAAGLKDAHNQIVGRKPKVFHRFLSADVVEKCWSLIEKTGSNRNSFYIISN